VGKRISKEDGVMPLMPSSSCVDIVFWLKLCGHRRTTVLGDINAQLGCGLSVFLSC